MAGTVVRGIDGTSITVPEGFDYPHWIERWDRMQRRYLVKRQERFETIVDLVRAANPAPAAILDLGCGTGSLTVRLAEAFPRASIVGIDFDPTMLLLAQARAAPHAGRVQLFCRDLQKRDWIRDVSAELDAAVSATALHWFSGMQLAEVYKHLAGRMRCGGIFLNADHVASEDARIQRYWQEHRQQMRLASREPDADGWDDFWRGYATALKIDISRVHEALWTPNDWVEDGLPLAWHFDRLREVGFAGVECFWRCDCDAIYGGVRA